MDQPTGLGLPEDLSESLVATRAGGVLVIYLNIDGFSGVPALGSRAL